MDNSHLGQALSLIVAICWSQNSLIYSRLGKTNNTDAMASVRLYLTLPFIILINLVFNGYIISPFIGLMDLLYLLLSGFIGFYITDVLAYRSYQYIGPRESLSILCLNPCISAILAFFFLGQSLSMAEIWAMLITLLGVLILVYPDIENEIRHRSSDNRIKGIILAVLSAFFQALSLIFSKLVNKQIDPYNVNLVRIFGGLITLSLSRVFQKQYAKDFSILKKRKDALLLLAAAFIGPSLGMCLEFKALSLSNMGIVTAITQTSPVMLLLVDVLWFKKKLNAFSVIGTLVSILGVMLLFIL